MEHKKAMDGICRGMQLRIQNVEDSFNIAGDFCQANEKMRRRIALPVTPGLFPIAASVDAFCISYGSMCRPNRYDKFVPLLYSIYIDR